MQCCEQVPLRGLNFHRTRQCTAVAKVERDGKCYCGIHDPVAKAERAAKLAPKKAATQNRRLAYYIAGLKSKS